MKAFVDTFAFLAWLNPKDAAHQRVVDYLDNFRGQLTTTEWVLLELADALSAPAAREVVIEFLHDVRVDPTFEIVDYDKEVFRRGMELFESRPDKFRSLTDCISFGVMADRELIDALTADHHFEQAGFRAVFRHRMRQSFSTRRAASGLNIADAFRQNGSNRNVYDSDF